MNPVDSWLIILALAIVTVGTVWGWIREKDN